MTERFFQRKLSLVIAVAIFARLALLFAFPQVFAFSEPGADIHGSVAYDEYAVNLLETGVYGREPGVPDAGLPPLIQLPVLSLVYRLLGRHYYLAVGRSRIFSSMPCPSSLLYRHMSPSLRRGILRHDKWIGA